MKQIILILLVLFFVHSAIHSQTVLEISPGDSIQIERTPLINFIPVTSVTIDKEGSDTSEVVVRLDSWSTIFGSLNIRTKYTIKVIETTLLDPLNIKVSLTYDAAGVLNTTLFEDFLINTGVQQGNLAADFSGTPTTGDAPLTVQFTDNSTATNTIAGSMHACQDVLSGWVGASSQRLPTTARHRSRSAFSRHDWCKVG